VAAAISIAANSLDLGIGAQSNGTSLFQGAIDEARVYCRALSQNEVQDLAQPPANDPPVALCQNVTVPSGQTCPVAVDPSQVDNGSYDPDGDPITLALDPPGPYPNGVTIVDLIVSDGFLADTCTATITVDCEEPPECLAGLWPMDEGSGPTIIDSSANGNDGAIFGAPTWVTGVTGLALDLNGTSDHVRVPDDATLDITGEITLAAWIKPEKVGTQYLVKKAVINVADGYELSLSTSGLAFVRFNQFTSANTYRIDATTLYPTDGNTWMHLAATYDGSTIRLYVNGVEENSAAATFAIAANGLDLGIGAQSDGTTPFQGAMDDVRVYCRALGATEIESLANCAVIPTTIDFGIVAAGSWRDETFTVINLGSNVLSGNISEACDRFSVVSGSGPYDLPPGDSLIVTVRFSPTISGEDSCVVETGNPLCDDVFLRGLGDETIPVVLRGFEASWTGNEVEVAWALLDVSSDVTFDIARKVGSSGAFVRVDRPELERVEDRVVFIDRSTKPRETYTYRVAVVEGGSVVATFETTITTPGLEFTLNQNYPNPFNPTTTISFALPETAPVNLSIYDARGSLVVSLIDATLPEGYKEIVWDGKDANDQPVSTGVYFYQLKAGKRVMTKKMVLLK